MTEHRFDPYDLDDLEMIPVESKLKQDDLFTPGLQAMCLIAAKHILALRGCPEDSNLVSVVKSALQIGLQIGIEMAHNRQGDIGVMRNETTH